RHKATHIEIPREPSSRFRVEYVFDPVYGNLSDVKIVPAGRPPHQGSSPTWRSGYFDLSMPRQVQRYHKTGGKIMVRAIKYYLFGSESVRLTQARCNEFFADDSNFAAESTPIR